jgi:hypothetical protein
VQVDDEDELWPENESAVRLFRAMLSQWRVGFAGPTGLDYAAVPVVACALRLRGRALQSAFAGMQVMEAEALRLWRNR